MKKRLFTVISALILTAFLLCISISAFDANDYDYSYSGGGSGGYSSGYDDDDIGGDLTSLVLAIIVVAIMGIYWTIRDKIDKHKKKNEPETPTALPNRTAEISERMRQLGTAFNSEQFKTYAKKVFADVQNAKSTCDPEPLRGIMTEGLFNALISSIRDDTSEHITYHCENIRIAQSWLTSLVRDGGYEYIGIYLFAKHTEYRVDDETGDIIDGSTDTQCSKRYLMKFVRSMDPPADKPQFCPNCGAPLDNADPGKCGYCGSMFTAGGSDWLLCDFAPVLAGTKDDGIRV
ncbi:MAG: TIM44-like domain-containing protein [Ruminiclostridium sp.]|nr:TIM44-like domain-containing protein [Ruminiclostridium sp.]